jgi:SanA protein
MAAYAQELGVPAADIVLDYAGRRTYDSCYRAKAIFGVEAAVLVTQEFHQTRAVYLCDQLGIVAVGLSADQSRYSCRSRFSWSIRETLASTVAWWDINILHPIPILGDKLPIGE